MKALFRNFLYGGILVLLLMLFVSCSSGSSSEDSSTTIETEAVVSEQAEQDQPVETAESQPAAPEEGSEESEVPEDLPIMPGSRKLNVTSEGTNISYEVDGSIDDVVSFYQQELPNYAWDMTRTPDNALSNMGTLSRLNENGDRLAISLQYNPMAEFVVVRIFINRAPE
jgi:hypothetical protein